MAGQWYIDTTNNAAASILHEDEHPQQKPGPVPRMTRSVVPLLDPAVVVIGASSTSVTSTVSALSLASLAAVELSSLSSSSSSSSGWVSEETIAALPVLVPSDSSTITSNSGFQESIVLSSLSSSSSSSSSSFSSGASSLSSSSSFIHPAGTASSLVAVSWDTTKQQKPRSSLSSRCRNFVSSSTTTTTVATSVTTSRGSSASVRAAKTPRETTRRRRSATFEYAYDYELKMGRERVMGAISVALKYIQASDHHRLPNATRERFETNVQQQFSTKYYAVLQWITHYLMLHTNTTNENSTLNNELSTTLHVLVSAWEEVCRYKLIEYKRAYKAAYRLRDEQQQHQQYQRQRQYRTTDDEDEDNYNARYRSSKDKVYNNTTTNTNRPTATRMSLITSSLSSFMNTALDDDDAADDDNQNKNDGGGSSIVEKKNDDTAHKINRALHDQIRLAEQCTTCRKELYLVQKWGKRKLLKQQQLHKRRRHAAAAAAAVAAGVNNNHQ